MIQQCMSLLCHLIFNHAFPVWKVHNTCHGIAIKLSSKLHPHSALGVHNYFILHCIEFELHKTWPVTWWMGSTCLSLIIHNKLVILCIIIHIASIVVIAVSCLQAPVAIAHCPVPSTLPPTNMRRLANQSCMADNFNSSVIIGTIGGDQRRLVIDSN